MLAWPLGPPGLLSLLELLYMLSPGRDGVGWRSPVAPSPLKLPMHFIHESFSSHLYTSVGLELTTREQESHALPTASQAPRESFLKWPLKGTSTPGDLKKSDSLSSQSLWIFKCWSILLNYPPRRLPKYTATNDICSCFSHSLSLPTQVTKRLLFHWVDRWKTKSRCNFILLIFNYSWSWASCFMLESQLCVFSPQRVLTLGVHLPILFPTVWCLFMQCLLFQNWDIIHIRQNSSF